MNGSSVDEELDTSRGCCHVDRWPRMTIHLVQRKRLFSQNRVETSLPADGSVRPLKPTVIEKLNDLTRSGWADEQAVVSAEQRHVV
jgi:hypothetical protein